MKHFELYVEHRYQDRLLSTKRIAGKSTRPRTIGSAHSSDIRLLGQDVGGIHALLQFQNDAWMISDTGTGGGTWIQKEAVLEHVIEDGMKVRIGDHELCFRTRETEPTLFVLDRAQAQDGDVYHQVVVWRDGKVFESHLLGKNEAFAIQHGGKLVSLTAPVDFTWAEQSLGGLQVRQRLVRNPHRVTVREWNLKALLDPEFRVPVVGGLVGILLLALAVVFAPSSPDNKMQTVVMDNPYSKLIYDSKLNKQLKKQSQALSKTMKDHRAAGDPGGGVQKLREGEAKVATPTTKVVRNIQTAGLSALIGKISQRASKNAIAIQAVGIAAKEGGAGPALGSVGGVVGGTARGPAGAMGSYKLGAIGTIGKGGGQNVGSGLSGLGQGGVGSGDVGFVEEEGEVEGGLDRDVIARYIKTQLGQIRYCYERQLSAAPDLYGKVQIKFVIAASGAVSQQNIGTSTLKNAMVEGCILRRVASWKFPEPKNGTSVLVTYPFLFKSTN